MILHCGANPPLGISRQPGILIGIKFPDRVHQPHHAFLDQVAHGNACLPVPTGDLDHKAGVTADQALNCGAVAFTGEAHQLTLLFRFQQRSRLREG